MLVHDALHGREPDARAVEVFRAVKPLEHTEQLVGVLHVEAHAVVLDEQHWCAVARGLANVDYRVRAWTGVLHRIRQEVRVHDADEARVAGHRRQRAEAPLDPAPRQLRRQVGDDGLHDLIQPGRLGTQVLAPQLSEMQQIVHQPAHVMGSVLDTIQVMPWRGFERVAQLLDENLDEPVHLAQWGPQIV